MLDHIKMNLSQTGVYFQPPFTPSSKGSPFEVHDRNSTNPNNEEKLRVRRYSPLSVVFTSRLLESGGAITEIPLSLAWNPLRILFGCNSGMIVRNEQIALAHERLHGLLLRELEKEVVDLIVPGFSPNCRTFIQSAEIAVQRKDQGRGLLDRISQISHPAIRKQGHYTKGESMKLRGSKVSFQIYDKTLQSGARCESSEESVIRYEVKLTRDQFSKYLPQKVGEFDRVMALDVDSLYEAFRAFTKDLSGYFKSPSEGKVGKPACFIVEVHREYGLPLDGLLELYRVTSKNTKATMKGVTREIRTLLEQSVSQETFEDLFPESLPEPVSVSGPVVLRALVSVNQEVLKWNLPTKTTPERVEFFSSVQTFPSPRNQRK